MNIRKYKGSDFNNLARLHKDFFNEMREWQGWEQLKLDEKGAVKTAKESLDRNSRIFVAENSRRRLQNYPKMV
ncbi:MAG: hypothetical protein NWE91_01545 [Candidatus Bathyarchaeota archaeon]|nr:hypothetical protein [Candidatus Bathyarchaeota archaeon]